MYTIENKLTKKMTFKTEADVLLEKMWIC